MEFFECVFEHLAQPSSLRCSIFVRDDEQDVVQVPQRVYPVRGDVVCPAIMAYRGEFSSFGYRDELICRPRRPVARQVGSRGLIERYVSIIDPRLIEEYCAAPISFHIEQAVPLRTVVGSIL